MPSFTSHARLERMTKRPGNERTSPLVTWLRLATACDEVSPSFVNPSEPIINRERTKFVYRFTEICFQIDDMSFV